MRQVLKWFGIGVGGLLLCLVVLFITLEWWAKPIVAHQASAVLGRKVALKGPIDVAWSWTPHIALEDIRVANATWSPEPFMSTIRRLSFRIDLRRLLQGKIILSQIDLLEPVVRLESSETGVPNWVFTADTSEKSAPKTPGETALPTVKDLAIQHGRLSYEDYSTDNQTTLTLAELKAETVGADEAITVNGSGQWEARPFQLTLHAGSLAALQAQAPYPVQLQLQLDTWHVELGGTLRQALALAGVDLDVSLAGTPDRAPDDSPQPLYRLSGHLTRQGESWLLESIQASAGQTNLSGRVRVETKAKRPFFRAELSAPALDVDNLMAVVSGPQSQAKPETKPSEDDASDPALDLEVTRAISGVLTFQSETLKLGEQTLHDFQAEGRLEDGHLTFKPAFDIAGGSVRATVEVEDRAGPLHSTLKAQLQQINVEQLLANFGQRFKSVGILQGEVDLSVSGRTLTQLLESIDSNVSLGMTDKANDTDVTVQFATFEDQQRESERLIKMSGEGRMRGQPVAINGRVGSLNAFYRGKTAYPVQADIQLGQTQVRLDGTVQEPRRFTGLKTQFRVSGPDPATLSHVLPLDLPHLPAYRLEGDLHREGHTLTVNTFKGTMGKSDLSGTLALDTGTTPMSLRGELHAQRLQIDELTAETAHVQDDAQAPAAKKAKNQQALPDLSIDPDLLRLINVDVRFEGKHIVGLGLEVRDVSAAVQLRHGELKITPHLVVGGGQVEAMINVVSHPAPMKSLIEATFDGVNLSEVLQELVRTPAAFGELKGHVALTGVGHALASFLDSSHGDVSLSMAGGRLDSLIVELVGLDVGEAIVAAFADKNDTVQIRCLVADFIVSKGTMQTQTIVLDTSDTQIRGEGFIDLGRQTLSLKLVPQAKDFSLFSAESPLYIRGTFSNISASPKLGEVLLSLAVPIKPGVKDNADCQDLLESVRQ